MPEAIKKVLMSRDEISEQAAIEIISEAREALQEYLANDDIEAAFNICQEYFGLEPDYIDELI